MICNLFLFFILLGVPHFFFGAYVDLHMFFNCRFETLLFKLEVLDQKARERAGFITTTLGPPIPVRIQLDAAAEVIYHEVFFFLVVVKKKITV